MIQRIEHALVMDTDDMPGRGGYAVVGLSEGVEQPERVFVAENFGISDFLHDPRNDRVFFSFFRVPNGRRRAFVRRFVHGTRRNATQNRVFVHTLFLEDATCDALGWLPWLLTEATFGGRPLRLDPADPLLDLNRFVALEWTPEPALLDGLAARFRKRLEFLEKRLPDAASAVASTIAALQHQRPVLLPQGAAYEQVVLLAWSMLPPHDRAEIAWTQHDAQNVHVAFELANVSTAVTPVAALDAPARAGARAEESGDWRRRTPYRVLEMNTSSEETHAEFHRRTARYGLRIRGEGLGAWFAWRDQLERIRDVIREPEPLLVEHLERLARTVRPDRSDPWVDGEEILELLWPNVEEEVRGGKPATLAVNRWASLLDRSGLGVRVFAAPPRQEWLERVSERFSADALVRFFTFGADAGAAGAPVREALAAWLLAKTPAIASDVLARFATQLARDRSSRVEPVVRRLFESTDGLQKLAEATPLNAAMGDLVLLATIVALQNEHPWRKGYVIGTLLRHLELSEETRKRVNANVADSVAALLRDDVDSFVRFAKLLSRDLQERLGDQVAAWAGSDEELARAVVEAMGAGELAPRAELLLALAETAGSDPLLVRAAKSIVQKVRDVARWDDVVAKLADGELLVAFFNRLENRDVPKIGEAVVAAAETLEGRRRELFVASWQRRIEALPKSARSEQLIAVVEALEEGDAREIRIARNRRAIEHGEATFETLNELDEDLWSNDERTYAERMQAALKAFAAQAAAQAQAVKALIDLLANPRVLPSVKLAAEARLPFALRDLNPREWQELVKMAPEKLLTRGSPTMIVARQLGANRDALDAARELASIAQRMNRRDALDGLAAGWIDSESRLQRLIRTVSGGRLRMTTNGPVPM